MSRTRLGQKLRDSGGETLVEVMASIVIGALSVALLFSCVMASSRMDSAAADMDKEHYAGLSAAEGQTGPGVDTGSVVIGNDNIAGADKSIDVTVYGGAGMYSYKRTGP